jgi:uncharacterized protein (DUF488 family)
MAVFYTIGHSNRPIGEFVTLLRQVAIEALADVRSVPGSRANPQFNEHALAAVLAEVEIAYRHIERLGGLRKRGKDWGPSRNGYWENESFRNYADYAATAPFREGLAELRALGQRQLSAVMCSEAVWWRCHRRIIADYLLASGETVIHILGEGNLETAHINSAAVIGADGVITYPGRSP